MIDEQRVNRWAEAWRKPGRDADAIFAWAREHGDMQNCLAGLTRSQSFSDPVPPETEAHIDLIARETITGPTPEWLHA